MDRQTLEAVRHFDDLPDSAYVKARVVQVIYGNISDEEVRRRTLDGRIPKPTKLGGRLNFFQVGKIRRSLARSQREAK